MKQSQCVLTDNARVAGARWLLKLLLRNRPLSSKFGVFGESTRHLLVNSEPAYDLLLDEVVLLRPLTNAFVSSAVDDSAVGDEALDEPMVFARAEEALFNALFADIEVPLVADVAVEVGVAHDDVADVAIDRPRGVARNHDRSGTHCQWCG